MGNLVAIVGRPNVGKSTLFNRLTRTRQAIVNEEAGTTRDRQYGKSEWLGREFSVVDTGGWVVNSDDIFEEEIRKQVMLAVDEADVILFVVDVVNGLTDLDEEVADILRRTRKPVMLVANKTDNFNQQYQAAEFYALGLGDPYCISAISGSGTGELLDALVATFRKEAEELVDDDIPRIAVVGRPNAGKSSLINAFIGEDRHIVTEIAGTTRDSIYTRYNKFGFDFYLVDTAGIRKKNKVSEDLEYYSVIRSIRAIESADVCILMLDATRGIESQGEDLQGDEHLRGGHPRTPGAVHGLPHHLCLGPDQAAHPQGAGGRAPGVQEPPPAHPHRQAERGDAAPHRGLSAPFHQGQVHQDKVCHAAAQHARALLCLLRQPAAVRQGTLPPLPGEQDAREVEPERHAGEHFHPTKITPPEGVPSCDIGTQMTQIRQMTADYTSLIYS